MTAAFYRDYIADLRSRIDDLHTDPESYQTYVLSMELLAQRNLVSYSLKRQRGQTDSLFYRRDTTNDQGAQMQQQTAFKLFAGFFGLGQFLASSGRTGGLAEHGFAETLTADWEYPTCAVHFSYRKKGQPETSSMKMLFVGLNGDADADTYERMLGRQDLLVQDRPFSSSVLWEWK
jgi:hypothetical protein